MFAILLSDLFSNGNTQIFNCKNVSHWNFCALKKLFFFNDNTVNCTVTQLLTTTISLAVHNSCHTEEFSEF